MRNLRTASIYVVLTTMGIAWAQSAPPDEAFQGLKWGDSTTAIMKRFPSATSRLLTSCNPENPPKYFGTDCTSLRVSDYTVAGLKFDLTFYLTYQDKALAEVGLSTFTWVPSGIEIDGGRASSIAKCNDLQSLLTARYGVATVTVNDEVGKSFYRTVRWYDGIGTSNVHMM